LIKASLVSALKSHIENQRYIEITFISLEDMKAETICCIPLSISGKLLLMLVFIDFLPDGYRIMRLQDISKVDYDETCRYFDRIVKQEGALQLIKKAPDILIEDWKSTFASLRDKGIIVIIDIGKEGCIHIGEVVESTAREVRMRCFSPVGVWDDGEWHELIKNITYVEFSTHYTNTYTKYIYKIK